MFNMTKRLWNINKIFSSRLSRYYGYDVEANVVIWTKYVMFKAGVPDCVGGPEFFLDRHPGGRTLTLFDVDCGIQLLSWLDGSVVWIWPTAHQLMTTGLGIILDTDCLVLVCLVSLKRPLQIWLQSCKCSVPESVPVTVIISGTLRRWSEPRSTDSTQIAHFSIVIFLKSGGCSPWVYRGGGNCCFADESLCNIHTEQLPLVYLSAGICRSANTHRASVNEWAWPPPGPAAVLQEETKIKHSE